MRNLRRNRQKIYFSNYLGEEEVVDSFGDKTGEKIPSYSEPKQIYCNVSASRGNAESDLFGITLDYSKTLCFEGTRVPITEESILWIGRSPKDETKHNYVVRAIAQSLNNTLIAVKEVRVS
jgi:hypothetical protein